jgi:GNAT superfamily N-acetyltransferase
MNLPPGFTSRPATPDDLDDVVALIQAWEIAHFGETEAVRSMLQYEWAAAWFDLERDAELIYDDDGLLVAYAQHATPDDGERFEAYGPVRPGFEGRGLGSTIVDWSEDRTRARLDPGSETRLWNSTPADDVGAARLLEARG